MHHPDQDMQAYVREVLDHLKDYSTPLWDRINAYDGLGSRVSTEHSWPTIRHLWPSIEEPNPYNPVTADYYRRIRNAEEMRVTEHISRAQKISKYNALINDSLRKLGQKLHTLDRSRADAIIKLRQAIEETSKKPELDFAGLNYLNHLQQILLNEHFCE